MRTLCKMLGLLFILVITGAESYVLISEFVPLYNDVFAMTKVLMATLIFNLVLFIFTMKYHNSIIKIYEEENE